AQKESGKRRMQKWWSTGRLQNSFSDMGDPTKSILALGKLLRNKNIAGVARIKCPIRELGRTSRILSTCSLYRSSPLSGVLVVSKNIIHLIMPRIFLFKE